jgi:hypothetical protein
LVNTLFWTIRVTRVQQKIFIANFSLPAKHLGSAGALGLRLKRKTPVALCQAEALG